MSPRSSSCPFVFATAYAQTGESASIASSFLDTTVAVAAACAVYWSIVMLFFPADVHFLDRAVRSSTCTVAFWTATLCPHALSGWMPLGLPFWVAHCVPAL